MLKGGLCRQKAFQWPESSPALEGGFHGYMWPFHIPYIQRASHQSGFSGAVSAGGRD